MIIPYLRANFILTKSKFGHLIAYHNCRFCHLTAKLQACALRLLTTQANPISMIRAAPATVASDAVAATPVLGLAELT